MRIIIDFGNVMGSSEREIRFTLMDALAEFSANRGPTSTEYVVRRYPWMSSYRQLEKTRQVERRKWTAETMRNSIDTVREESIIDFGITHEQWDYHESRLKG